MTLLNVDVNNEARISAHTLAIFALLKISPYYCIMNRFTLMSLILQILKTVPLFESLTDEEHQAIMEHITLEYYPAHYKLFEQGQTGEAMYIIKSGMIGITKDTIPLAGLGEGDFFGEMALLESSARNASAETLSDCELFVLKRDDFARLIEKSPAIAEKVSISFQKRKNDPYSPH